MRAAPDRLVGVGSVDISRPRDGGARDAALACSELGFKAIRVLPWLWELPPTHARFYPVFSECCELGVPFCTQVGHTGPLMPSEVGRPIPYIDQVAIDFPDLVDRLRAHRLPVDGRDDRGRDQAPERLHRHLGLHGQALSAATGRVPAAHWRRQGAVRHATGR
ncbi:MAG: amidohydrolase family protein [Comamonadaceae bacterium]|nr:amidohydrolase family protein [Comamonadaceae bacterium]